MKVWMCSIGRGSLPWPLEKFRYPAEQMLITLFPGEKAEFCDTPFEKDRPGEGELLIHFDYRIDQTPASLMISAGTDLGPDRMEEPADEDDHKRWEESCHGGYFSTTRQVPLTNILEGTDEEYRVISHTLKEAVYRVGIRSLVVSGELEPGQGLPWGMLTGVRPVKLPTRALLAGRTPDQAQRELEDRYEVSPSKAALAVECAQAALDVKQGLTNDSMALYIGIPFCPTRCAYCSFISSDVNGSLALVEPYVDGLCREIELAGGLMRERGLHVSTAYMGGGTPTTLSAEQLDRVLSAVERFIPIDRYAEFTVEAGRPDTITADKLEVLWRHAVRRVSINPQTMEEDVLQAIGRDHTAAQVEKAMALCREHFGGEVNMDLITGLPTDTLKGFKRTLDRVLAMAPANITVHTLALKNGSQFMEECRAGAGGSQCPPETVELMLELAARRLRYWGYAPYYLYRQKYMTGSFENIGWARREAVCQYNIIMMEELQSVLALGAGGITKLVDPARRKIVRLNNPKYAKEYLDSWDKIAENKRTAVEFQAGLAER